ncbi:MAG: hypothetical protein HYY99_00465 [Candidatus Colwellbacteria bacterium]|nr:hypothetical protein [Candidatus Colwellbacteria bacterium]
MASDTESLRTSGGLGTEPKTFSPADLSKEPVFAPEITSPAGGAAAGAGGKKLGLLAGAIGVLALAAAVGYFFVWPLITKEEPQETVVTAPTSTLPTAAAPTPPAPVPSAHQSYFVRPPANTKQVVIENVTLSQLASSLKASSGEVTSTSVFSEILLQTTGSKAVSSTSLIGLIAPGSGLEPSLESDVTAFAYYINGKSYPGYIFKLKSGADLKAAQTAATQIENSANLAALYPESPGAPKGSWKSGSVSGVQTRYLVYASAGASLNYGWVNNYLVVSTSFEGFKKAVDLLK